MRSARRGCTRPLGRSIEASSERARVDAPWPACGVDEEPSPRAPSEASSRSSSSAAAESPRLLAMADDELEDYDRIAALALVLAASTQGFNEMSEDEQEELAAGLAAFLRASEQGSDGPDEHDLSAALRAYIREEIESGVAERRLRNDGDLLARLLSFSIEPAEQHDAEKDAAVAGIWAELMNEMAQPELDTLKLLHGLLEPASAGQLNGMQNLGNTCYINSVLQPLLRNAPLVHDLKATLRRCSPTEEGERSLLEAVCDLVEQMDSDAVVDPTRLTEALEGFGAGSQVRPRVFSLRARGRTAWTDLFAPGRRRMRKSSWCLSGSS